MKLFATLYLDEDVSVLLAKLLRSRGFKVTTALEQGMLHQDDEDLLEHAVVLERCVLTHNRLHFEALHGEYVNAGRKHFGIIIANRRDVYELARRVGTLLNTLTADEIENQLLYI